MFRRPTVGISMSDPTVASRIELRTAMNSDPTPEEMIEIIERHGRDGREFLFNLVLPDKTSRLCSALCMAASAHVRRVIANLLASLADPAALLCLLERLNDSDPDVTAAVADAAGNSAYDQRLPEDLRARLGSALINLLTDVSRPLKVRTGAIYGLGLMRFGSALECLLKSLESPEPLERLSSAEALAHIADERAIPALRNRMRCEDDDRVKCYVRMALESFSGGER
jgi:HEAT repeat protein